MKIFKQSNVYGMLLLSKQFNQLLKKQLNKEVGYYVYTAQLLFIMF